MKVIGCEWTLPMSKSTRGILANLYNQVIFLFKAYHYYCSPLLGSLKFLRSQKEMSKLKRENKKHNIYTHINISRTHCFHYFTKTTLARAPMTFYVQVQWLLSALYLCSCRIGFCFWIPSFREESTALASSVLSSLILLLSSLFAFCVLTKSY